MHVDIASKQADLIALCRRHGVARLEVFGSAARGTDFNSAHSDADFLVTFAPAARDDLAAFADFKETLETLLGRPVDLVEREALEASRNFIRRRRILAEATTLVGMIQEDLIAERVAIDSYREMIAYLANDDPTTRRMLEGILAMEEAHADDLVSLLEELGG
ncbi:MAG: nucleotidyltransferase domain-containing protein [Gammaproteobacteria bacterium]